MKKSRIAEIAALTRRWSAVFHGSQIDLEQFKKEISGM
jgi:hypothetical protein